MSIAQPALERSNNPPRWINPSTGELCEVLSYTAPDQLSNGQDSQSERVAKLLASVLASTRLDLRLTNAHTAWRVSALDRVPNWERSHFAIRNKPQGGVSAKPLTAWSRSWYSPDGRERNRKEMLRRGNLLTELAAETTELPKLISLTYSGADAGWLDVGAIRRFMNALRTHVCRLGATVDYFWTAEYQERWALHFHVVLANCPFIPKDKVAEWWPHGWSDIRAVKPGDAIAYLVSYIQKGVGSGLDADLVRHVMHSTFKLRRFGCSRRISAKLDLIPAWLNEWAAMKGADLDLCEWVVYTESQDVHVFYEGEYVCKFRERAVKWRILTELLS